MNRVVFHIGVHKTGSTTIQTFLRRNEDVLRELRINLPKAGCVDPAVSANSHNIAWEALRRADLHRPELGTWAELTREISKSSARTTVLSAEDFEFLTESEVSQLAKDLPGREKIAVVYLRRHDHLFVSEYAHLLREGITNLPFEQWLSANIDDPRYDYQSLLARWRGGGFELIVRPFQELSFRHGDLSLDFLDALGVKKVHFGSFKLVQAQNPKLHGVIAILLREALARIDSRYGLGEGLRPLAPVIWWHLQQFLSDDREFNPFEPDARRTLVEKYSPSYSAIEREYLGGATLFSRSVSDLPRFDSVDQLSQDTVLDGLTGVFGAVWQERQRLKLALQNQTS
jgi:hypothetical protein